jgi:hypothetical protein
MEKKMSLTSLGTTLAALKAGNCMLYLRGIVNVEGGSIAASGRQFGYCEECEVIDFEKLFFMNCDVCGRNRDNHFWINSGDGDGMYLVFAIATDTDENSEFLKTIGFVVLFDSNYEFSKSAIEETIEDKDPQFNVDYLQPFAKLESLELGSFRDMRTIWLSDTRKDTDSSDAQIQIRLDGEVPSVKVKAFCERPGEGTGPFPDFESPRPRVLIGINSSVSDDFLTGSKIVIENEAQVLNEWLFSGICASHIQPMGQVATWYNYLLSDAIDETNSAVGWLMQGALHGDSDCKASLQNFNLVNAEELLSSLLTERGMISAAQDVLKNKNFMSDLTS